MLRWSILLLGSLGVAAMCGCSGTQTSGPEATASTASSAAGAAGASSASASATSSDDSCPLVSAGPPPVCPEGCVWNGKECRKREGIIMDDAHRDAGPAGSQ